MGLFDGGGVHLGGRGARIDHPPLAYGESRLDARRQAPESYGGVPGWVVSIEKESTA